MAARHEHDETLELLFVERHPTANSPRESRSLPLADNLCSSIHVVYMNIMSASFVRLLVLSAALTVALILALCVCLGMVSFSLPSSLPKNHLHEEDSYPRHPRRRLSPDAPHEQLAPSTILDPTTKQLSPSAKYTDLVHALTYEYMPGSEEEPSWETLEDSLRAMQSSERLGYRPNPTGPLANTTYDELRRAITAQYFASWRSKSQTRQFMSALEIMYKLEHSANGGRPVPIDGQPYLFIASAGPAYNMTALREMNISHIISVTSGVRPQFPDEFEYLHIQGLRDEPKDPRQSLAVHFNETTPFIDAARSGGGRCLVHCWEGRSRSVTVITAYLIEREGMTREAALRLIRKTRPMARPNDRFMRELEELSLDVRAKAADELDERLSPNMRILQSDGSLAEGVQYSTFRRALITGNWARPTPNYVEPGEKASWNQIRLGLDSMRRSEAYTEANVTTVDGPLAYVTYSQLANAIIGRFPLADSHGEIAETTTFMSRDAPQKIDNDKNKWHQLASSLWVMRKMEIDGEPVPIEYFWGTTWRPWNAKLYIGSIGAAYDIGVLLELGITHVVSITTGDGKIYPDHFEYHYIREIYGNGNEGGLYDHFDSSYDFIKSAIQSGGRVLVHCHQGLSRSATILSAFLIRHKKTTAAKALDMIRQTRSRAAPKKIFMEELERYAEEIGMRKATEPNVTGM